MSIYLLLPQEVQAACIFPLTGNATISSACAVGATDGVEGGNLTYSTTITIQPTGKLVYNPGYSIIKGAGGTITKNTGGQILKSEMWLVDTDCDGWPLNSTIVASLTNPNANACNTAPHYVPRSTLNAGSYNNSTGVWTLDCNDAAYSTANSCCASNYGQACSACNACNSCNSGTIQCNGSCSATAPPNPAWYGTSCSVCDSGCPSSCNTGTILCTSGGAAYCTVSSPPSCTGQTWWGCQTNNLWYNDGRCYSNCCTCNPGGPVWGGACNYPTDTYYSSPCSC